MYPNMDKGIFYLNSHLKVEHVGPLPTPYSDPHKLTMCCFTSSLNGVIRLFIYSIQILTKCQQINLTKGCARLFLAGDLCPCYHNTKLMTQQLQLLHNQNNSGKQWKPVELLVSASLQAAALSSSQTEKSNALCLCTLGLLLV